MEVIKKLKRELCSDNPETALEAVEDLIKIGGNNVGELMVQLLQNNDYRIRDRAAMVLMDIGYEQSAKPLIEAIEKGREKGVGTGTLVHALEYHDCSEFFLSIVEIALYGDYEEQSHALIILKEHSFKISKNDMATAKAMVEDYLKGNNKCDDYELLLKELSKYLSKIERKIKKE